MALSHLSFLLRYLHEESVPAEFFVGAGAEGRESGAAAHNDAEESSEGVGGLGGGVIGVPVVGDILIADAPEAFADEVKDHLNLSVAARTDLA